MNWIIDTQPWPWYVAGPLIGLTVPALLLLLGKSFGVSSCFRHLGSACAPHTKLEYLKQNDWRKESWNLWFVGGILLGAFLANQFLLPSPLSFLPESYDSLGGRIALFVGGLLVGFGTRYADGCTSGHSIMGLSNLNWPSLVATVSFFAGGLTFVWLVRIALGIGAGS